MDMATIYIILHEVSPIRPFSTSQAKTIVVRNSYLVGTCYDSRELALLFACALDHRLDDAWVVRTEVDEAMGDAGLPERLKEGK